MQQHRTTNGLAVAALVLGILWLAGLGALLALIFGLIALSQIRTQPEHYSGKGMAIAGVVLGAVGIVVPAILIALAAFAGDEANDGSVRRSDTAGQEQATSPAPITAAPEIQTTTTVGEPDWTMPDITRLFSLSSLPSEGMVSCGDVAIPAGEYILSDDPFFTVGVFGSPEAATAYLDGIERAINSAAGGPVVCLDVSGDTTITFVDPSTATRADADTLDEQVTVEFAPGNTANITQREVRCGNVIVSGTPSDLPPLLERLGC